MSTAFHQLFSTFFYILNFYRTVNIEIVISHFHDVMHIFNKYVVMCVEYAIHSVLKNE